MPKEDVLEALETKPGMTVKEISKITGITDNSTRVVIKRLVKEGDVVIIKGGPNPTLYKLKGK